MMKIIIIIIRITHANIEHVIILFKNKSMSIIIKLFKSVLRNYYGKLLGEILSRNS